MSYHKGMGNNINRSYVCLVNSFHWRIFLLKSFFNNILHSFQLNILCLKVPSRFFFGISDENFKNSHKNKISAFQCCWNPLRERLWRHKGITTQWYLGRNNDRYLETENETCAPFSALSGNVGFYTPIGKASVIAQFALNNVLFYSFCCP